MARRNNTNWKLVLLVLISLIAMLKIVSATCTPAYSGGNWDIGADTTCSNNHTLVIDGNITVQPGFSLTLNNVTLNMSAFGEGHEGINVTPTSTGMFVYNSTIQNHNQYNYTWTVYAPFEMDKSNVSNCGPGGGNGKYGLTMYSNNSNISNSKISFSQVGVHYLKSNENIISNTIISDIIFYGIWLGDNTDTNPSNNNSFSYVQVTNVESYGINIDDQSTNNIFDNLILENVKGHNILIDGDNNLFNNSVINVTTISDRCLVLSNDATGIKFYNSIITNNDTAYDCIEAQQSSSLYLINVSVNRDKLTFVGVPSANITFQHFVWFNVTDSSSGSGLEDVNVSFYQNGTNAFEHSINTSVTGVTNRFIMTELIMFQSSNTSYIPYNVTFNKTGYVFNYTNVSINHSGTYYFSLAEVTPPACTGSEYSGSSDWVVDQETVCSNANFVVYGDVNVTTGGNLTLYNVTLNLNGSSDGDLDIQVFATSTGMFVYNSTVQSNNQYNYTWRVYAPFIMDNSIVRNVGNGSNYLVRGLAIYNDNVTINNSHFENVINALYIVGSNNKILNTRVETATVGIRIEGGANNTLDNVTINATNYRNLHIKNSNSNYLNNIKSSDGCWVIYDDHIWVENSSDTIINNSLIDVSGDCYGVYVSDYSQNTMIVDTVITNAGSIDDMWAQAYATTTIINSTVDRFNLLIESGANISFSYYAIFNVTNTSGLPVSGANITVQANNSNSVLNLTANPNGLTNQTILAEVVMQSSINETRNPHNVSAIAPSYDINISYHTIDHSGVYNINLLNNASAPLCSGTDYAGNGNWVVDQTTFCENVSLTVNGNIIINNSANLTFDNVTLTMATAGRINVTDQAGGMFVYDSLINSTNTGIDYTWVVHSDFLLENSSVIDCGETLPAEVGNYGLTIYSDNTIINSSFFGNNDYGVNLLGDNNTIINTVFNDSNWDNIRIGYTTHSSNNNIIDNVTTNSAFTSILLFSGLQGSNNNYINNLKVLGGGGLDIRQSENTTINNSVLNASTTSATMIFSSNASNAIVENTIVYNYGISNATKIGENSFATFLNVTIDRARLNIVNTTSNLTFYHYAFFNVTNSSGIPISNANLTIYDNNSLYIDTLNTSPSGLTNNILLIEGTALKGYSTGYLNISLTPHEVWANKSGYDYNISHHTIDHGGIYSIVLLEVSSSDIVPPSISLNWPLNNTQINNTLIIDFNFTAIDDVNTTLTCELYLDNSLVNNSFTVQNNTATILTASVPSYATKYNWSVNCTDGTNSNVSQTFYFTVNDTIIPTLTVQEPQNITYASNNVSINYTVSDANLDTCWYYNGTSNNSLVGCSNSSEILVNGQYTFTIYVNDTSNNINSTSISFNVSVDTSPPNWTSNKTHPTSPTTYNETLTYQFNTTWVDASGIDQVWIAHNFTGPWTINRSVFNSSNEYYYNIGPLAAGVYGWQYFANDTSGYENNTINFSYTIQRATPVFNITIIPSTITYGQNVTINCTSNTLQPNRTLVRNGLTLNLAEEIDVSWFSAGTYNFTCAAPQSQNYTQHNTSIQTLTVIQATTYLNLTINNTESNTTILQYTNLTIDATVNSTEGYLELWVNNTLVNNGTTPINNLVEFNNSKIIPVTAVYSGSQNWTNTSKTFFVNVTQVALVNTVQPSINLSAPPTNTQLNDSLTVNFNFTVIGGNNTFNCTLRVNNFNVSYNDSVQNNTLTTMQHTTASYGSYFWNVYCNDGALSNISQTFYFNITDTLPPIISNVSNVSITNESVVIIWDTDENATATIFIGTTTALGPGTTNFSSNTTHHLVQVNNLQSGTLYYYNVSSRDPSTNTAQQGPYNFTTLASPISPTITALRPINNFVFTNTHNITLNFTVDDDNASVNCTLYVDGAQNQSVILTPTANATLNVTGLAYSTIAHNWNVICNDSTSVGISTVNTFYVYEDGDGDIHYPQLAHPNTLGDCDDTDSTIHVGAPEVLDDGIDQDCDGSDSTSNIGGGGGGGSSPPPDNTDNNTIIVHNNTNTTGFEDITGDSTVNTTNTPTNESPGIVDDVLDIDDDISEIIDKIADANQISDWQSISLKMDSQKLTENYSTNRSFVFNSSTNTTLVNLTIDVATPLYNVSVYEDIPKCVIELLQANMTPEQIEEELGVHFNNWNFEVEQTDPLIVWHFDIMTETTDLSYSINKNLLDECKKQFKNVAIADRGLSQNPWLKWLSYIIGILITPVVVLGFVFFNRFNSAFIVESELMSQMTALKKEERAIYNAEKNLESQEVIIENEEKRVAQKLNFEKFKENMSKFPLVKVFYRTLEIFNRSKIEHLHEKEAEIRKEEVEARAEEARLKKEETKVQKAIENIEFETAELIPEIDHLKQDNVGEPTIRHCLERLGWRKESVDKALEKVYSNK
ncbi:hypothetical protein GOV04_04190 [Candidatus Woesearchaeota archaeon]|nr:hypothetical protein [Candidatus Woesearchaeota archaeon]